MIRLVLPGITAPVPVGANRCMYVFTTREKDGLALQRMDVGQHGILSSAWFIRSRRFHGDCMHAPANANVRSASASIRPSLTSSICISDPRSASIGRLTCQWIVFAKCGRIEKAAIHRKRQYTSLYYAYADVHRILTTCRLPACLPISPDRITSVA